MDINEALTIIRRFGDSFSCKGNTIPNPLKRSQFTGGDGLSYSNILMVPHEDEDAIWAKCLEDEFAFKIVVSTFMYIDLEPKYSWDQKEKTSHCTLIFISNDYLDLHCYVAKWLLANANPKFYKDVTYHDRATRYGDNLQLINKQQVKH